MKTARTKDLVYYSEKTSLEFEKCKDSKETEFIKHVKPVAFPCIGMFDVLFSKGKNMIIQSSHTHTYI